MKKELKQKLKSELDPKSYDVIVNKGTEAPYSGQYNMFDEAGMYHCKACGESLFSSDAKFDAGCGWPSFDRAVVDGHVKEVFDESHGMRRTEIVCAHCDAHLGHVFNDGPTETGLRYCVNSVSIDFSAQPEEHKKT